MAFYERDSTAATAIVQQHEWLLVYMKDAAFVYLSVYESVWSEASKEGWIRRNGITTKTQSIPKGMKANIHVVSIAVS